MNMNEQPSLHPAATKPATVPNFFLRRVGTAMKMGVILFLMLFLLIPLGMIRNVLEERVGRRNLAVEEISASWGAPQTVAGPLLMIPYTARSTTWEEHLVDGQQTRVAVAKERTARAFFLPETLMIDGEADPKRLFRGIYSAIVYTSTVKIEGHFAAPDFSPWQVDPEDILWDQAVISLAISDLRGAQDALRIEFDSVSHALMPGSLVPGMESGVQARLQGLEPRNEGWSFSTELKLNGSERLLMAPFGMNTIARWNSKWPDPSFQGAFLPAERSVDADGFTAAWNITYYGRGYPQQWTSMEAGSVPGLSRIKDSLFGVHFIQAVDSYRHAERSMKYGMLFFVLIFTAFFLFEVLTRMRIHPFQYALVGAALCLFYLALLALSEFIPFGSAYALGAGSATAMITLYSAKVLKGGRRSVVVGLLLVIIYALLYIILRLQDYSLLAGTAGLFLALAAVMFATRNIDWYARDRDSSMPPPIPDGRPPEKESP